MTSQLCAWIPEASQATAYRRIDLLAVGGVLEVAEEHRVRGAVRSHYRLRRDRAVIGADVARDLTPDDQPWGGPGANCGSTCRLPVMKAALSNECAYSCAPAAGPGV